MIFIYNMVPCSTTEELLENKKKNTYRVTSVCPIMFRLERTKTAVCCSGGCGCYSTNSIVSVNRRRRTIFDAIRWEKIIIKKKKK